MIITAAPAIRPMNEIEQQILDAAVGAVEAEFRPRMSPLVVAEEQAGKRHLSTLEAVCSDPGYAAAKQALSTASWEECGKLQLEYESKYGNRLEQARKDHYDARSALDEAEAEEYCRATEGAFLAGELYGLREGIRLLTLLQAGRLEEVTGIAASDAESLIRGALVDDELAASLMSKLAGIR